MDGGFWGRGAVFVIFVPSSGFWTVQDANFLSDDDGHDNYDNDKADNKDINGHSKDDHKNEKNKKKEEEKIQQTGHTKYNHIEQTICFVFVLFATHWWNFTPREILTIYVPPFNIFL